MLVIADAAKPVALAGVMGGRDSEVTAATTDVLLESARFDPLSVRKTARALAMRSDSSYRFERGHRPDAAGASRAPRGAADLGDGGRGTARAGFVAAGANEYPPKTLSLRLLAAEAGARASTFAPDEVGRRLRATAFVARCCAATGSTSPFRAGGWI